MQQTHQGDDPGPKGARRDPRRALGLDQRPAMRTHHLVVTVFRDLRLDFWKLPDLLPLRLGRIRQVARQVGLAAWTGRRPMLNHGVDFARRQQLALMPRMPWLATPLPRTRRVLRPQGYIRWITRRWPRGILRGLLHPGHQLSNLPVQRLHLRLQRTDCRFQGCNIGLRLCWQTGANFVRQTWYLDHALSLP